MSKGKITLEDLEEREAYWELTILDHEEPTLVHSRPGKNTRFFCEHRESWIVTCNKNKTLLTNKKVRFKQWLQVK